jgi:hypothetical protein
MVGARTLDFVQFTFLSAGTNSGESCLSNTETLLATAYDTCTVFHPKSKFLSVLCAVSNTLDRCARKQLTILSVSYCCPADTPLHDCVWRGTPGDCADAKCMPDEVSIATETQGDSFLGCNCTLSLFDCLDARPSDAALLTE